MKNEILEQKELSKEIFNKNFTEIFDTYTTVESINFVHTKSIYGDKNQYYYESKYIDLKIKGENGFYANLISFGRIANVQFKENSLVYRISEEDFYEVLKENTNIADK